MVAFGLWHQIEPERVYSEQGAVLDSTQSQLSRTVKWVVSWMVLQRLLLLQVQPLIMMQDA